MQLRAKLVPAVFLAYVAIAQTPQSQHAQLVRDDLGNVHTAVDTPRPLSDVVTAIRRQYGWVADYEESEFLGQEVERDIDGVEQVKLQKQSVVFPEPTNQELEHPLKVIELIANQFQSQNRTVRVDEPSPLRYSVSTRASGKRLLLDTMIVLPHEKRSIDRTVAAICEEAARSLGSGCVMGGLVDGQLLDTFVEIGSDQPTQARLLLAQALEAAPNRKVWMLTYDTTEKTFAIGIQPAVRLGKPADGRGWVTPLPRLSAMP